MPGKSKRKKLRYSTNKQNKTVQSQAPITTTPRTVASAPIAGKPQSPSLKSTPAASKAAAAQYTPDLLKHVGTELKISVALSASIIIVIIVLAFIIH